VLYEEFDNPKMVLECDDEIVFLPDAGALEGGGAGVEVEFRFELMLFFIETEGVLEIVGRGGRIGESSAMVKSRPEIDSISGRVINPCSSSSIKLIL
jgi:hypothetical protein